MFSSLVTWFRRFVYAQQTTARLNINDSRDAVREHRRAYREARIQQRFDTIETLIKDPRINGN
jgi:hypothetical protein